MREWIDGGRKGKVECMEGRREKENHRSLNGWLIREISKWENGWINTK